MPSLRVYVECAHCEKSFGVRFKKGAQAPSYFDIAEDSVEKEQISTSVDLAEFQDEYGEEYSTDVVVICRICGGVNVLKVPHYFAPKGTVSKYAGIPGKSKGTL